MMKKLCVAVVTLAVCLPAIAHAGKTTYIATNHRFNYVKLKEIKPKEAAERSMTQPLQLDEQGIREALRSVKLSRSYIIKKEVDTQDVFDDASIDFLAPNLAKAFTQATDQEEVVFSYLMKNPIFILRNDRLNLGQMWVAEDGLHIRFDKLFAKVTGDIDKRGNEAKAIARARGLRINLELQNGQKMAINDTSEIVLDLNYNYAEMPEEAKPLPTHTKTMAGETVPVPGVGDVAATNKGKAVASNSNAGGMLKAPSSGDASSVKDRLGALEDLKREKVITNEEYKAKRKEILNDL
jgi:hypothetical protein